MSAVIVVYLIKIQTMFRSKVRPFRANKAPDVNKTKGLKRKIKMSQKRKVSFYFCMWSLPFATTLFPMPPVSWLSIWVRGQDNMKTEPQWWISSSCPSLSWSGRRDQWGSRSPGDCFDDWRWSFWWLKMISIYSAPGWSSRSSSQKDRQSFLVGPVWSPFGSLGPRGRTLKLNQWFYHR